MRITAELYAVFTAVLFSLTEVVSRRLEGAVSAASIGGVRFFIGAVVLLPFALPLIRPFFQQSSRREVLAVTATGILHVSVSITALQLAVWYGHAALTALLISTSPVFAALFEKLLYRETLPAAGRIGLLIGLAGITLIIFGKPAQAVSARNEALGLLFGIVAAVTFALSTVIQRRFVLRYGPLLTSTVCFLSGSLFHLLVLGMAGIPVLTAPLTTARAAWLLLLGAGISGVAYLAFFRAMRTISAARASAFLYLKPGIAAVFAAILLGERTGALQFAGFAVVLFGLHFPKLRRNPEHKF